jgi:hypothetical protein
MGEQVAKTPDGDERRWINAQSVTVTGTCKTLSSQ